MKEDYKMENSVRFLYEQMGISKEVYELGEEVLKGLEDRFKQIDETAEYNQLKVIKAMQKNYVGASHLTSTTGYGYDDAGRDTLEAVYADTFHTESALVRPSITCGTHALAIALSSQLRPGDELLSPVGKPYDTLEEVIGIRPSKGSLAEYGISYRQVDLLEDGEFDYENIKKAINEKTKLVTIQRSKGYQTRKTLSVKRIGELISFIKNIKPDVICMVDNCYGEFVERIEPTDVGADMIVGSLIKNPGGGLAPIGGYIAGKKNILKMQHTVLHHRDLEKKWELRSVFFHHFIRAFSLRLQLQQVRLRVQYLQQIYMRDLVLMCFLTAGRAAMTLSRR